MELALHSTIQMIDTRNLQNIEVYMDKCYTHMILYQTDLPKCLELKDAHASNPYHLLFYMIARFYFFDNGNQIIRYYYPKTNQELSEKALSLLPSRFHRITEKNDKEEYVQLPGCRWYDDSIDESWIYSYVRDLYKPIWEPIQQKHNLGIYISRRKAPSRRVQREEELIEPLQQRGFFIIELESFTFEQQIQIFRAAKVVIGSHGAGLTWLIFCHPKTYVIEINGNFPKRNHYADIAKKCELQYYRYLPCKLDAETGDILEFEPNQFLETLDTMFGLKCS
jgi:hypothetical protein